MSIAVKISDYLVSSPSLAFKLFSFILHILHDYDVLN